jgi:hypothetical protein
MSYHKDDPRSRWKPYYVLIKEYPGFKGRFALKISKDGYTENGVIPVVPDAKDFPEFWFPIHMIGEGGRL